MRISDLIEQFIKKTLEETGQVQLQRCEIAQKFNVVPSQINYVLTSRFTPEQGYIVESRRGGKGYILIKRISMDSDTYIMHIINSIGDTLEKQTAKIFLNNILEDNLITKQQYDIMSSALFSTTLNALGPDGDSIRAQIFKNMLISILL